jgi:hypothetical protein
VNSGAPAAPGPVVIDSIQKTATGVEIRWTAPAGGLYEVQWKPSIIGAWTSFTNTVTSVTTSYLFIDDGTQSGGLAGEKFYRVNLLP